MTRKTLILAGIAAALVAAIGVLRTPKKVTVPAASEAQVQEAVSATVAPESPQTEEVVAAPVQEVAPVSSAAVPTEAAMMDRLRATLNQGTPQVTLDMAREIQRAYPDGAQAEECSLYAIDALIALNRISDMREDARLHLRKWQNTPIAERVMARTGVHPEIRPPPGFH